MQELEEQNAELKKLLRNAPIRNSNTAEIANQVHEMEQEFFVPAAAEEWVPVVDNARLTDNPAPGETAMSWVSKRVRVLTATHKGCEGVVTSVTKSGALNVHIDGTSDEYCPALLPKDLEIVTNIERPAPTADQDIEMERRETLVAPEMMALTPIEDIQIADDLYCI